MHLSRGVGLMSNGGDVPGTWGCPSWAALNGHPQQPQQQLPSARQSHLQSLTLMYVRLVSQLYSLSVSIRSIHEPSKSTRLCTAP